jgi:hypothetical protein
MTPESENTKPASGDRGVFGNLPSERPGVRSPRRGEGKGSKAKPKASKGAKPASATGKAAKPAPSPPPKPPPPAREYPPPPPTVEAEAPDSSSGRGSVEEVAWAGITVAAEAATLGVRLFSRALEAVRERR